MAETDFGWPDADDLPAPPRRVIWHWTAGRRQASMEELTRYHVLVEHHEGAPEDPSDDRVVVRAGVPVERNCRSVSGLPAYHRDADRGYAAHTRSLNSGSVAIALCGMRGAKDFRPSGDVAPGPSPITLEQVRAMLALSVEAALRYELEVGPETFFGHYEAEYLHGVDQLPPGPEIWKWNVTWVPGVRLSRERTGFWLREQLQRWLDGDPIDDRLYAPPAGESSADAVRGMEG